MRFLQYIEKPLDQMATPDVKQVRRKVFLATAARIAKNQSRYSGFHEPFFYRRYGSEMVDNRRRCRICHYKISAVCFDCNVALFLRSSDNDTSCFKLFYDKSNV
jgi:hypothetical protein